MGCVLSHENSTLYGDQGGKLPKSYRRPKWKSDQLLTAEGLKKMRDDFWDTQPHYGGDTVIWETLRAACETDFASAKLIIEAAAITVASPDMTVFYDERGTKYELPNYVVASPSNLVQTA